MSKVYSSYKRVVIKNSQFFRLHSTAYKGNARIWWKFAYNAIVETEIKRRKRDWSWLYISTHCTKCRSYAEAYRTKLISKKLPADAQQSINHCEESLDLFNLILIRNRVDFEVEKSGLLQKAEPAKSGWFSGWGWGGGKADENNDQNKDIRKYNIILPCMSFI